MDKQTEKNIKQFYNELLEKYGDSPQSCGWSPEGQKFRFEKLINIADLDNKKILDVGCGLGHLYSFLCKQFINIDYTGIDINEKMIAVAQKNHANANFYCTDILENPMTEKFDYAFISGIFNDAIIPNTTDFLQKMIKEIFKLCNYGLAFNFISKYVNVPSESQACHDPNTIFDFCINNLSRKVSLYHHYERCEVAVFVYRENR